MKMNMQRYIRFAYTLAFLLGVVGLQLQAETAALWKLDFSTYTGLNTRCLVDPANDMAVAIQGQQKEPPSTRPPLPSGMNGPWSSLPPNPDQTGNLLDTPVSTNAILYTHGILFSSPGVTPVINNLMNSFTVEGWHYQDTYAAAPGIGQYQPFFALGRSFLPGGWSFGYYNLDDTNNLYFAIYDYNYGNGGGRRLFPIPVAQDAYYLKWTHYALVYDTDGGGGFGTWQIFLNSSSYGVITNQTVPTAVGTATAFYLGGDAYNSQYFKRGGYDYWRISDQALATNQFLNAGVATTVTSPKTLAFYRLDVNDDNSFDISNRVANAHHLRAGLGGVYTQVTANAAQAVASVPNPDQSARFRGSRTLNKGSIAFRTGAVAGKDSYLISSDGLGYQLGTNTAWTVESWINFTSLTGRQVIFDVKLNLGLGSGWMFMNYNGLGSRYSLYIGDVPGFIAFPGSTGGIAETSLNEWHHLALTFDPAAGAGYQGAWECFLDSTSLGVIKYSNSYTRVNSSEVFCVGGRGNAFGDSVYGAMDLVRVTQGVLATNQFLNAGGYAATTNAAATLAYWKLDSDGVNPDTASQVDVRYSMGSATNVAPVAGSSERCRVTILNPDSTPGFIGNPAANTGSVLITNGAALAVGNLGNKLELDTAFTVEGWMKWNNSAERATQVIAGTKHSTAYGWLLTLRKSGASVACHIECATAVTNVFTAGTLIIDADLAIWPAAALAGGWHHIGVVYEPDVNDRGRWTLYLDGLEAGAADNAVAPFDNHDSHTFLLGGQVAQETSFDGYLDCWRVSEGVLTAEQMLYVKVLGGTLILVH